MKKLDSFVSYGSFNSYNRLLNNLNDEEFDKDTCTYDPSNII